MIAHPFKIVIHNQKYNWQCFATLKQRNNKLSIVLFNSVEMFALVLLKHANVKVKRF